MEISLVHSSPPGDGKLTIDFVVRAKHASYIVPRTATTDVHIEQNAPLLAEGGTKGL